jgi:DNA-directed RNA polymerase specialized sigma24 family protein
LPEEQKRALFCNPHEMTFQEIAEMEGVSINTLLARKRYAINYLRNRLADSELFHDK